ncbi:hypothetical protein [Prosthecobacter sp.]|uniref:hypothetical protein n=1 Tax=Prosthecobacter sp. TaxID=1965333 RepID=UPI00248853DE|nr:hypothetical protein [Prosthecobacter sp.]MDI1314562.1 hypothetical protein [Prosthecobacter sp.]
MKIPVFYELNGCRRCLLVQDGETINVGRGETCSIRLTGDAAQEVELTAQFVNGCQFLVVHPANGSVPYAQPLPWKVTLAGMELELNRPFKAEQGKAGRELILQGLSAGETRLVMPPDKPLLLGASDACEVVIPDAGCPDVLLALWAAAGGKVLVQVLDESAVVGWVGRAGESEAELELPVSLSLGGRVLLIRSGEAVATTHPLAKPMVTAILAKNAEYAPKIVARQGGEEGGGNPVKKAELPGKPTMQAPSFTGRPLVLPPPAGLSAGEGVPILTMEEAVNSGPKVVTPKAFILASWLLVGLTYAVVLLPGQGLLTPEQIVQLWYAAGGLLVLTLLLGLGVLLK